MAIISIQDNVVSIATAGFRTGPSVWTARPGRINRQDGDTREVRTWVRAPPTRDEAVGTPGAGRADRRRPHDRRFPDTQCVRRRQGGAGPRPGSPGEHDGADG